MGWGSPYVGQAGSRRPASTEVGKLQAPRVERVDSQVTRDFTAGGPDRLWVADIT